MAYADYSWYAGEFGGKLAEDEAAPLLERASDAVDKLTFSRIPALGWDGLTEFQQGKVRRACCLQAEFLAENADALESPLAAYAVNGVSMQFGNGSLYRVEGGLPVANAALACLAATGLMSGCPTRREVR